MASFMQYLLRPFIDAQSKNTEAYQRSLNPARSWYLGNGGQAVGADVKATAPATIAVGPTHKRVDGLVTGNVNDSFTVQALTDPRPAADPRSI